MENRVRHGVHAVLSSEVALGREVVNKVEVQTGVDARLLFEPAQS